jgi:hypothetical protein
VVVLLVVVVAAVLVLIFVPTIKAMEMSTKIKMIPILHNMERRTIPTVIYLNCNLPNLGGNGSNPISK